MSKCGIKKYDDLPEIVGCLDVGYLRSCYNDILRRKAETEILLDEAIRRTKKVR